MSKLYDSSYNK